LSLGRGPQPGQRRRPAHTSAGSMVALCPAVQTHRAERGPRQPAPVADNGVIVRRVRGRHVICYGCIVVGRMRTSVEAGDDDGECPLAVVVIIGRPTRSHCAALEQEIYRLPELIAQPARHVHRLRGENDAVPGEAGHARVRGHQPSRHPPARVQPLGGLACLKRTSAGDHSTVAPIFSFAVGCASAGPTHTDWILTNSRMPNSDNSRP
jgi:hypothetical protein